jgi:hypothetical protein
VDKVGVRDDEGLNGVKLSVTRASQWSARQTWEPVAVLAELRRLITTSNRGRIIGATASPAFLNNVTRRSPVARPAASSTSGLNSRCRKTPTRCKLVLPSAGSVQARN